MESRFGQELRRLRGAAGLSLRQLGRLTHYDPGYISKIENGVKLPSTYFAEACDEVLRAAGVLTALTSPRAARTRSGGPALVTTEPPTANERDIGFAMLTVRALPGSTVTVKGSDGPAEWELRLPGGRVFGDSAMQAQLVSATWSDRNLVVVVGDQAGDPDRVVPYGQRSLVLASLPLALGRPSYLVIDRRVARQQLRSGSVTVPGAFALDELTLGILWALTSFDDALLGDDVELAECQRLVRADVVSPETSLPHELLSELSPATCGWLGSDSCARFILQATENFSSRPVFWTREQRGEEAASWLFFRHKLDYLRLTRHRFGSTFDPQVRNFCIPEDAIRNSFYAERLLMLLAAALMEAFGIRVQVSTDPALSTVDGFVLAPTERAVIATWVRTDGRWHVDSTTSRSVLANFAEVIGHAQAHRIQDGANPVTRLSALADYLDLDWTWVTRWCRELSPHTCAHFARPRSRLLSTEGVDTACRFLGGLHLGAA